MKNESLPRLALVSHKVQQNDGQGRVNYEVVKAALASGYRVTVLATSCADEIANHPNGQFVKIGNDRLPTELLRNVVFAFESARWIRTHRGEFDLIQANGFVTWEPCDIVAAHFVHTAWGKSGYYPFNSMKPLDLYQRLYTALNSRWEQRAFTRAGKVISVSRLLVPELLALGVKRENIEVIQNGVDVEQFHPGQPQRESFGLPVQVPMAIFVGDIRTPRKNLGSVLRALVGVPSLHLAVAGGVQGSPYPAMAESLGVAARVHFLDRVSRIPELMRSVDFFAFPSHYEAHPLVLLEAMASGLPSVVSGTFGAEHFLGNSGVILSDPDDIAELIEVMAAFISDPVEMRRMSLAGRTQALNLSWDAMAASYLEIYRRYEKTVR
jgi:glycosyltransferase involved in cell wall biosynthesis